MNWSAVFLSNPLDAPFKRSVSSRFGAPMGRSFLDSLSGMSLRAAEAAVHKAGHKVYTVPEGAAITLIARPNTVILWNRHGKVVKASAGDPLEMLGVPE